MNWCRPYNITDSLRFSSTSIHMYQHFEFRWHIYTSVQSSLVQVIVYRILCAKQLAMQAHCPNKLQWNFRNEYRYFENIAFKRSIILHRPKRFNRCMLMELYCKLAPIVLHWQWSREFCKSRLCLVQESICETNDASGKYMVKRTDYPTIVSIGIPPLCVSHSAREKEMAGQVVKFSLNIVSWEAVDKKCITV